MKKQVFSFLAIRYSLFAIRLEMAQLCCEFLGGEK